jgi:putative FmdB family regulatory protein
MPIYEYKCSECGAHIEKMQKISDEPLKICENCGGKLEKQLSLSGFQFKGEGWYVTDYSKKSSGGKEPKSEKSEKSEKTDKSEKSSAADSTAKTESASKETKDTKTASKKD